MAIQRFKLAFNNARIPLVSTQASRAVFVPGIEASTRAIQGAVGSKESTMDYQAAQLIYAENVMPVPTGIRSVGYAQRIAPTVNDDFDSIFALRDADENTVLYSPSAGKNYIYDDVAGAWSTTSHNEIFTPLTVKTGYSPANSRVTYAYVDGFTFVCFSRLLASDDSDMSIMVWDTATKTLQPANGLLANVPYPAGEIDGISSSNGYLLLFSGLSVAWAGFNGTAFDYQIYANGNLTGSGWQTPEDIKAPITALISLPGGFVIFTGKNAIAANYHAQSLGTPWVFREIPNAGGLESYEQATVEGSKGTLVAYTTSGLQSISLNSSELDNIEVADFIATRVIERYNLESHEFTRGSTNLDFYVKVSNIANRFTVISYGTYPGVYSYALVYDGALKRWGKLRMVHRDCFYWNYGAITGSITYAAMGDISYSGQLDVSYDSTAQQSNAFTAAQHSLAFLKASGEVLIADWSSSLRDAEDEAVAVIGRVQLTRTSNVQFNRVELEGFTAGQLLIAPSYDGANLSTPQELITIQSGPLLHVAGGMIDCKNFNLIVQGTFNLSTIIIEGTTTGKI